MIDGVEKAVAQLPPDVKVIPGHGPVSSLDDVRAYVKMLKDTRAVVADALKKQMNLAQMKEQKVLDPWKKYSGDFISEDAFLETLFNSLTGQKNGKFIKLTSSCGAGSRTRPTGEAVSHASAATKPGSGRSFANMIERNLGAHT